MTKNKLVIPYVLSDFISASLVWFFFNWLRFHEIAIFDGFTTLKEFLLFLPVWGGQFVIPFFWLSIYYFSGYYNEPIGKSRVTEFFQTLGSVLVGVLFLFFLIILNDLPRFFNIYYALFFSLFVCQFLFTYIPRLCITLYGISKIKSREWAQNVLIIGTGRKAQQLSVRLYDLGYEISGFVKVAVDDEVFVMQDEVLGKIDDLENLINAKNIQELVVAIESRESGELLNILYPLYRYRLPVKTIAEGLNPLSRVNIKTPIGVPLIDITDNNFSYAEENIKHFLDKVLSVFVLVLFSPLFIYLSWRVKRDSKGRILFKQERIGYMGKPFMIYKFRTMYEGAESGIPQLSEEDDERITPFGRFMRNYRLDELPQFWNVLKGDMSLVGPRPERKYFIDQIVKKAPYYYLMHNVRPGITSLGMVKYGYAKNVDEMIERLAYDVLYYENMSLLFDLKILVYTIKTVATGKGI
ncbi:sugar transferase [Massilibacteroides sp.]|uniref:sugar transferase n=1 Tax=Massilibacteroides sp. TaxID=2034766 RepID=UPI0026306B5A|nr:sugar transferase [Massilibacteroides sp.]MDD4515462.1 sugar transferase [Massilibacteroides sp.]